MWIRMTKMTDLIVMRTITMMMVTTIMRRVVMLMMKRVVMLTMMRVVMLMMMHGLTRILVRKNSMLMMLTVTKGTLRLVRKGRSPPWKDLWMRQ